MPAKILNLMKARSEMISLGKEIPGFEAKTHSVVPFTPYPILQVHREDF
jgi:hypothetical protein